MKEYSYSNYLIEDKEADLSRDTLFTMWQ